MLVSTWPLENVNQTGEKMRRLVCLYWPDLGAWLERPFVDFYVHVCRLPYIADPPGVETVSRPAYTLNGAYGPRDCDDKAVLCASWWHGHGRPVRFVASSTKPDKKLHHVFLQLDNGVFVDATYKKNQQFLGNYPYFSKLTKLIPLTPFF